MDPESQSNSPCSDVMIENSERKREREREREREMGVSTCRLFCSVKGVDDLAESVIHVAAESKL